MDVAFIVNPASGRGKTRSQLPKIKAELESAFAGSHTFSILKTRGQGEGELLAKEALIKGAQYVIAIGGDGTLNEVLQAVVGTGAVLGVLPHGTGNDFAREIGMLGDVSLLVDLIRTDRFRHVDVGRVQFDFDNSNRFFLNIAGCGFDTAVADRVNKGFRLFKGVSAYIAAVVSTLMTYRAVPLSISIGETPSTSEKLMLVAIANAKCYGGGMKVAPSASIEDGRLDVVVVREISRIGFLSAFPRVFSGTHLDHSHVLHFQSESVRIESEEPRRFLLDGELFGTTPATFSALPKAIKFLVP